MSPPPPYDWHKEGAFSDVDGALVRAYDDLVLLRSVAGEDKEGGAVAIPAGTIATALFFQTEVDGYADLECHWPEGSFSFATEETRMLRLHTRREEKNKGSVG